MILSPHRIAADDDDEYEYDEAILDTMPKMEPLSVVSYNNHANHASA